jgi:hypothetical protein
MKSVRSSRWVFFKEFLRQASYVDAGQTAALDCFGCLPLRLPRPGLQGDQWCNGRECRCSIQLKGSVIQ